MTLKDLIKKVNFEDVWGALKYHCDYDSRFVTEIRKMFIMLSNLDIQNNEYKILIDEIVNDDGDNVYYVFSVNDNNEKRLPMAWLWEEWLGSEIVESTFDLLDEARIVAFCMHEMSMDGFDYWVVRAKTLRDKRNMKRIWEAYTKHGY